MILKKVLSLHLVVAHDPILSQKDLVISILQQNVKLREKETCPCYKIDWYCSHTWLTMPSQFTKKFVV